MYIVALNLHNSFRMNLLDDYCRKILDNMATATILLGRDKRVLYVNTSAESFMDRSAKKVVGASLDRVIPSTSVDEAVNLAFKEASPVARRDVEYSDPSDSTREVRINLSVTPLSGALALLEVRNTDFHRQIYEDEARNAEYLASQKLLRGLAHEIKNPLGGIRGAAQLLELELGDDGMKEYTEVIIKEADRLRTLIDRMVGPSAPPVLKPGNIHEPVEHVFRLVSINLAEGVHIERDYDPSIPETCFDRDQIIQSLLNLARNAIESVGGRGHITFKTRVLRRYNLGDQQASLVVQVSIEDDGPGVPQSLHSEIFFPMVTGKAEGTGLGLPITQALIKGHGGLVKFHSAPGHTAFEILLPVKEVKNSE